MAREADKPTVFAREKPFELVARDHELVARSKISRRIGAFFKNAFKKVVHFATSILKRDEQKLEPRSGLKTVEHIAEHVAPLLILRDNAPDRFH